MVNGFLKLTPVDQTRPKLYSCKAVIEIAETDHSVPAGEPEDGELQQYTQIKGCTIRVLYGPAIRGLAVKDRMEEIERQLQAMGLMAEG